MFVNFGFRIADCGSKQSPRRGLSLTEVLIAMGILTLGLLGVASVFPVGSFYMQRAEIYDVSSSLGQSAMNDIVARGLLDPWSWFVLVPPSAQQNPVGSPNYQFNGIDTNYAPHTGGSTPISNTFTRPFAEALEAGLKIVKGNASIAPSAVPQTISRQFGNAYVIDPMGVAAVQAFVGGANPANRLMYGFPSASLTTYPTSQGWNYYNHSAWDIWRSSSKPSAITTQFVWPIRRVTFRQSNTGWNLNKQTSEAMGQLQDDLSYEFPERADRPAKQMVDVGPSGNALARKWTGDYSWIATVVPTTNESRDLMASSPQSALCDVSVVVIYKRTLPSDNFAGDPNAYFEGAMPEREVAAAVISTGLNGGELLLRDMNDNLSSSAFTNLKSHNFMMVCGPHPNSSATSPKFFLNWYQIISIESTGDLITDSTRQRIVTLRGPQWPWLPATTPLGVRDYSQLSNDLCGGIIKGAVAVHTKSMCLQDSRRGGVPPMGRTGEPPLTNPDDKAH